jgi:hypothetical protein
MALNMAKAPIHKCPPLYNHATNKRAPRTVPTYHKRKKEEAQGRQSRYQDWMKDENATFCNGACGGLLCQTSILGY